MKQGYLGLFRKFFDHEFWNEERKYSKAEAWIDLMQSARYGTDPKTLFDKRGSYTLEYGDVYISLRYLAKRWQWSKNKVNSFLNYLEKKESISVKKKDSHRTIIHIAKLRVYKEWIEGKRDSEGTVKGQSGDSEGTKKKKVKKENKEKNKDIYIDFPELNKEAWDMWKAYKRKIKSPYKTERGEKAKIAALIKLSNGDKEVQLKLINHAIDEEWKGIHVPSNKMNGSGKGGYKTRSDRNAEAKEEFLNSTKIEIDITPKEEV